MSVTYLKSSRIHDNSEMRPPKHPNVLRTLLAPTFMVSNVTGRLSPSRYLEDFSSLLLISAGGELLTRLSP